MNYFFSQESYQVKNSVDVFGNKDFLYQVLSRYPETEKFQDFLFRNIDKSGIKKVTIEPLKYGAGVSLPNRIVLSSNSLNLSLVNFLFNLFHEIAHHHQFKKYGYENMIKLYHDDVPLETAVDLMYKIEVVADEFATRKLREMVKEGYLSKNLTLPTGNYKTTPKETFVNMIGMVREMIKNIDYRDTNELSEKLYELIKN